MKTKSTLVSSLLLLAWAGGSLLAAPVGTAFTYQGQLADGGQPANGSYDLKFTLYDDPTRGSAVAGLITNSPVVVSNGLFTTTLDFGPGVFNGEARWLQIDVRTNGGGVFTQLSPRQQLAPMPYALHALGAGAASTLAGNPVLSGLVTFGNISGPPFQVASATVIPDLNADLLDGIDAGQFAWLNSSPSFTGSVTAGGDLTGQRLKVGTEIRLGSSYASISGGWRNTNNGLYCIVGGGSRNTVDSGARWATLGGGEWNRVHGDLIHSTVSGGKGNEITPHADYSTIGGGSYNRIEGPQGVATIGGGYVNVIRSGASFSTIGGGNENDIGANSSSATIAGGYGNDIGTNASYSTIGGGGDNDIAANSQAATIAGGIANDIGTNSDYSAIGGGDDNNIAANSTAATIAGGYYNDIGTSAACSAIGGGYHNTIGPNAPYATIPGGYYNYATNYAFAAGRYARATHTGSFVWSDTSSYNTYSFANNSATFRASGGYRFYTGTGSSGAYLAAGSGSWTSMSDRNAKEQFEPVNAAAILDRVVALPLTTWKYKTQDECIRHIGPMAQDFKAAFGVGETGTGITTVDADGVALAAIQGLNQKLEAKEMEITELKQRLEKLEQLLNANNGGVQ